MSPPSAMRAAILLGPRRLQVSTVPLPQPGAGQVRVRIEGCGVCGSNLGPWRGVPGVSYPLPPGSPGHEAWGRIDAVGTGVDRERVGEAVALVSGAAFAEYDVADAAQAIAVPPELFDGPLPGEALGCIVNIFRRAAVRRAMTVAIVGIGFIGAGLTRLCARAGARVIAVSRRSFALQLARRLGAEQALPSDRLDDVATAIAALTDGRGCDAVIEAVGTQDALDLAARLPRTRGVLVVAGYHQDGPRVVNMQEWNWRGIDVINAHERYPEVIAAGVRSAVELVRHGIIDPNELCTHTFALEQLGDALGALEMRPDGFLKAVIRP
ncbi:MAG: zinc-binding dehydrogenase [Candidatus Binatia bacterium]